jgi:predicted nucleotidyltransferase
MEAAVAGGELLTVAWVRDRLVPVLRRYDVEMAVVFGSVARAEPSRRSDVDLIVVRETDRRFLDRYEGIYADLFAAMGGPALDLLIYTPDEFEAMRGRRFVERALAEGVTIYERER